MISPRRPFQWPATQYMKVNVIDRLARVTATIHDETIARIGDAEFVGDLLCGKKHSAERLRIRGLELVHGIDVFTRNDQDMNGRARIDILECQRRIILVDD